MTFLAVDCQQALARHLFSFRPSTIWMTATMLLLSCWPSQQVTRKKRSIRSWLLSISMKYLADIVGQLKYGKEMGNKIRHDTCIYIYIYMYQSIYIKLNLWPYKASNINTSTAVIIIMTPAPPTQPLNHWTTQPPQRGELDRPANTLAKLLAHLTALVDTSKRHRRHFWEHVSLGLSYILLIYWYIDILIDKWYM